MSVPLNSSKTALMHLGNIKSYKKLDYARREQKDNYSVRGFTIIIELKIVTACIIEAVLHNHSVIHKRFDPTSLRINLSSWIAVFGLLTWNQYTNRFEGVNGLSHNLKLLRLSSKFFDILLSVQQYVLKSYQEIISRLV